MFRSIAAAVAACLVIAHGAAAAPLSVKGADVTWSGKITGGSVTAKGGKADGTVERLDGGKFSGTFSCALSPFDTGNDLRNEHMRDKFLSVKTFPAATLEIAPSDPKAWTGKLTVKGETKSVSGTGEVTGSDFVAAFTVNLDDYPAIGAPTWQDVVMDRTIQVTVKGKLGG